MCVRDARPRCIGAARYQTLEEAEIERVKREIVRVPAPPPLPEKPQIAAAVPAS
jgi:hypothetical protein